MEEEKRKPIIVKEKKEKLQKVKNKYNKEMSDATAKKIYRLEIADNVLATATVISGIAAIVDYIVPDPLIGIDEAVLTALTTLLGTVSGVINSNIKKLVNEENAKLTMDDAQKICKEITDVKNAYGIRKAKVKSN